MFGAILLLYLANHAGIYPDLMHILDLQIVPDSILSALFEFCERRRNKEAYLLHLYEEYVKWCADNRSWAILRFFHLLNMCEPLKRCVGRLF